MPRVILDENQKKLVYAFDDFKTLIEKFPNSKYAPDARKRMILLREQLADRDAQCMGQALQDLERR